MSKYWKIPPEHNARFVGVMEDVLEVYARSYDPKFPIVCMDESRVQLVEKVQVPIPAAPNHPEL